MPWKKVRDSRCPAGKPLAVVKVDDNELEGCHATDAAANAQLAALNAAEREAKGMDENTQEKEPVNDDEVKEVAEDKTVELMVVGGPTTFAALQAAREAQEMVEGVRDLTFDFRMLADNVMYDPTIEDKAAAMRALAEEFAALVETPPEEKAAVVNIAPIALNDDIDIETFQERIKRVVADAVSGIFKQKGKRHPDNEEFKEQRSGFMVYKTATGDVRWMATYSNKFRDRDRPPEILSEAAHKEFVQAVKAGEWEYPELWLYHVKGSRCGAVDWLAYDDSGFAVATGYWDTGKEWVAEILSAKDDIGVSHGMPNKEIRRDEIDPSVIVRYRTREISPLPPAAAANELTGFNVLKENVGGATMPLQEEDRAKLDELLGEGSAERLEAENAAQADKAAEEGLECKEAESETAATETEDTEQGAAAPLTVEDIAAAVIEPLQTIAQRQDEQDKAISELKEIIGDLAGIVTKMHQADEERVAEVAELTPAASLKQLIARSVVGAPETKVDGRSTLARDKPKEAPPLAGQGQTGIPLVDALISGADWREAVGMAPVQQ